MSLTAIELLTIIAVITVVFVFPIILIIFILYRWKLLFGVASAKHFCCRQGFHKLEKQNFNGNDYVNRSRCVRCNFIRNDDLFYQKYP